MKKNTNTTSSIDLDKLEALARAATRGPWKRSERLNGPFWHISSDYTIGGEPCKSGRQAIAAVHGESKRGATAYAAMFEANADFIAATNPATVLQLIQLARRSTSGSDASIDERAGFEKWMSDRGEAAPYAGDGLYEYRSANQKAEAFRAGVEFALASAKASGSDGTAAAILAARAEGRAEAVEILTGLCAESGIDEYTGWGRSGAPEDEGTAYWKVEKLRELFKCEEKLHDLFDRAECMYWQAKGEKDQAETEMRMVERAPFYKPLHDFLSKHQAYDLMGDLKLAATSGSELAPDAGKKGVTTLLQAAGAMRLVRCHNGSGEPFEAYDMDIADRVVAELRAQLAQQVAICQPLTDGQIVGVLHSLGVDTYPSKYGFDVLQVSATSVPTIRTVVEKCAALAHQSPSINQQGGAPIGYLPAYEISRLQSGHDANVRSAKFGPSTLNGDVAVYLAAPTRATQADQDAMDATRWSKEPPTEQGEYWNWDGDEDHAPMIYHVLWSGTAKKCFVSMGQYDIKNAIWCDEFGGWWLKIEQPSISAGSAAIAASKEGA